MTIINNYLYLYDRYQSEDDLLNERGYDAQTGQLTDTAMTLDRRENGGLMMAPNGGHMIPPPNDYESYEDLKNQQVRTRLSTSLRLKRFQKPL